MSVSAMKQALEALERGRSQIIGALVQQDQDEAITALRQAIAEAEKQEPVAWREVAGKTTHYYEYNEDKRGEPLYAAPQPDLARVGEVGVWGDKREWVGLTSEEKIAIYKEVDGRPIDLIDAIEAKLKEKNCG
jgi:hypothetical protein